MQPLVSLFYKYQPELATHYSTLQILYQLNCIAVTRLTDIRALGPVVPIVPGMTCLLEGHFARFCGLNREVHISVDPGAYKQVYKSRKLLLPARV